MEYFMNKMPTTSMFSSQIKSWMVHVKAVELPLMQADIKALQWYNGKYPGIIYNENMPSYSVLRFDT